MSPEQVKSLPVTAASDVFSLGGTLYFAATGRHPFDGEGDYEVLVAVCRFLGLKVELAVDGTRVAAYPDAGFARFTATELSARRRLLTKLSSKLLTIPGSGSGSPPTVWDSYEPHSQTCPRRRRGGAQVRL